MRIGGRVNYYRDADGERSIGTITEVSGTGKSGYKELDLVFADGEAIERVPHEMDADEGAGHWREIGAPSLRPKEDKEEAPSEAPTKTKKAKKK